MFYTGKYRTLDLFDKYCVKRFVQLYPVDDVMPQIGMDITEVQKNSRDAMMSQHLVYI